MKLLWAFLISCVLIIVIFLAFGDIEAYFGDLLNRFRENRWLYSLNSFLILSSDIVLPVPSSVVMFLNGTVLGVGLGFLLSYAAVLVSSAVGYYLGRFTNFGKKRIGESKSDKLLEKYGGLAIVITRGIPILAESLCFVCGFGRQPFRTFMFYNFVGYVPVCLLYAYFGSIAKHQNLFYFSFFCSLGIAVLFWVFGKRLMRGSNPRS